MANTATSLMNQQLDALLFEETNLVANLSNASALLNSTYTDLNWVGFYLYNDTTGELDLGPFQGKVACMHIKVGAGVVGTAFETQSNQRIADVHQFPGHIACDSASNAEVVIPITKNGHQIGVLDVDSPVRDRFSAEEEAELAEFVAILTTHID